MSAASGELQYPAVVKQIAGERVALIASQDVREDLSATLRRPGRSILVLDDGQDVVARYTDYRPTLIVLWVDDTTSALSAHIAPLARSFDETPIILTCPRIDRRSLRVALTAGATGVVLGKDVSSALNPCADAVQTGQICVPRVYGAQVAPPALSSREKQILGLVVMGFMNGQIAQQLFLAESTVKSHLSSAFRKLGVSSRNEAVKLILDPESGLGMGILALVGDTEP
jgi:DNA-binding NarL/FixJ family response regulator